MANRTVTVAMRVQMAGALSGVKTLQKGVADLRKEFVKAAEAGKMDQVGDSMLRAGIAMAAGMAAVSMAAARFEKAMSAVSAATSSTTVEQEKLRSAALAAGASTQYSATEAAMAIVELGKAGISTKDILEGGLDGALSLAAAGSMDVAAAAEIAASAMVQFQLSGKDLPHVSDLLAAGAGKAQGSVNDLGLALNQSGLIAGQMGLSVEETTGSLAAFASAGLMGSDAGTSFKTMLMMLANPTEKASNLMDELGISAYDASGNFVGAAGLAGQLQDGLSGLTQQQRDAALAIMFGTDAVRAANVLYREGQAGIQGWTSKVNDSGYAAKTASKMNDNLIGDLERLMGALETAFISGGSGGNSALRELSQLITWIVDAFSELPGPAQQAVFWVGAAATGTMLLGAVMAKAIPMMVAANAQLGAMGPMGAKAAAGLTAVRTAMGPWALAIGAVVTVAGLLGSSFQPEEKVPDVDALSKSLDNFRITGESTGEMARMFGPNLESLGKQLRFVRFETLKATEANKQLKKDAKAALGGDNAVQQMSGYLPGGGGLVGKVAAAVPKVIKDNVDALDEALTKMAQNGGNHAATFAMLAHEAEQGSMSIEGLKETLPKYTEAVEGAKLANTGLGKGFGDAETNAGLMTNSLEDAQDEGLKLTEVFNLLNGAATQFAHAEIDAEASLDDFTEAMQESGGSMDVNTEKGRASKEAMLDVADAAIKAAEAKYEETQSTEAARYEYDKYISQLRDTMIEMGLTAEEADRLLAKYAKFPDSIFTKWTIKANVDTHAIEEWKSLEQFQKFHGVAQGAVFNANGNLHSENHVAQIAKAGEWRVWAEDETGGEAYIPLAESKRNRSLDIWRETGKRLGAFDPSFNMRQFMSAMKSSSSPVVVPSGKSGVTIQNMEVKAVGPSFNLNSIEDNIRYRGLMED